MVNPLGTDCVEAAVVRDPGGAVVALGKVCPTPEPPHDGAPGAGPVVVWHEFNTAHVDHARANYGELFGWESREPLDLGELGVFHPFAWESGGPVVGAIADASRRPGIHPQWLFHFAVPALEPAMEAVRKAGGVVLGPIELPDGGRVAVCDDAQGAAFALRESPRSASSIPSLNVR